MVDHHLLSRLLELSELQSCVGGISSKISNQLHSIHQLTIFIRTALTAIEQLYELNFLGPRSYEAFL